MNVKDKVVLITGASAGIGKITAELLYEKGAKLALAARSMDKLHDIESVLKGSFAIQSDMTNPKDVTRMIQETVEHFGRLDVLINNAGQGMYSPLEHVDLNDFKYIMALNVYGPLQAMQEVIPVMRKQGGGAIINISTKLTINIIPGFSPYAATKSALNTLTLTARKELAEDGIVVSLVYPGLTDTDFRNNAIKTKAEFMPGRSRTMPIADPPEKVADRILQVLESGEAEVVL